MANSDNDQAKAARRIRRRLADRIYAKVIAGVAIGFVVQAVGGLIYAGRSLERIEKIEEHIKETTPQELRILTNTLSINHERRNQKKISDALARIENRQRKIEIRISRINQ